MYKKIFLNQCGYHTEMMKKVTFRTEEPVEFCVLTSDGRNVFEGRAEQRVCNEAAKEINYVGDFSDIKEVGRYYIIAKGLGESDTFEIGESVYHDAFQKAMHFFYLQRCGCELPEQAAGEFTHKVCHAEMATVYGTEEKLDVTGGWHDAGDYGRYVGPGAMAVAQLLSAYEENQEMAKRYTNSAQQKKEMPAYLEELKYELDWMMKMQREDGALYHKVGCYQFCGFIMPEDEKDELVISPVSVTATADFAAVTAMAVRHYKGYDEKYAQKLTAASKKAYNVLKDMELPGGFKNPKEITTGEYDDVCDKDERYWAAAELYKTFGDEEYRTDFEALIQEKIYHGYGWADMGSYGNVAYLTTEYPVSEQIQERIKKSMIELADEKLETVEADGYGTALKANEYIWGSNLSVANNGLHL